MQSQKNTSQASYWQSFTGFFKQNNDAKPNVPTEKKSIKRSQSTGDISKLTVKKIPENKTKYDLWEMSSSAAYWVGNKSYGIYQSISFFIWGNKKENVEAMLQRHKETRDAMAEKYNIKR